MIRLSSQFLNSLRLAVRDDKVVVFSLYKQYYWKSEMRCWCAIS